MFQQVGKYINTLGRTEMWNKKLQEIKKMNAIFGEEINDGATDPADIFE